MSHILAVGFVVNTMPLNCRSVEPARMALGVMSTIIDAGIDMLMISYLWFKLGIDIDEFGVDVGEIVLSDFHLLPNA